jgi:hypothetical protein
MATRYYLTRTAPAYTPANKGAWDDTASAVTDALDRYKEGGGQITTVSRAETSNSNTFDVLLYKGVTGPLGAQTVSGTVTWVLAALESGSDADMFTHVHVWATTGDTNTVRGTLLTDYVESAAADEWPTGLAVSGRAINSAQTVTNTTLTAGDRIVVEIGYIARNVLTASRTGTLGYGTLSSLDGSVQSDLTSGGDATVLPSYIEFSADLTEVSGSVVARETQAVVEPAYQGSGRGIRLTQAIDEVGRTGSGRGIRLTQAALEVIYVVGNGTVQNYAHWGLMVRK